MFVVATGGWRYICFLVDGRDQVHIQSDRGGGSLGAFLLNTEVGLGHLHTSNCNRCALRLDY